YIKTGGGIYPKISFPIEKINQHKKDSIGNKIFTINSAILSVEATEIDESKTALPIPADMMLLPISEVDNFLKTNKVSTLGDTAAIFASYNSTKREYSFDIAKLLNAIIKADTADIKIKTADFIMIPVDVVYINGVISEIRPQKYLGAATIRSGKNQYSPLRLELIYSGF
ncbi:MAG: DUF4270 domain-containing protein, partial [Prevotellaceae bacterium]|nr:DUF4270 domain-containing protein [Prevotellaceae bacterium]